MTTFFSMDEQKNHVPQSKELCASIMNYAINYAFVNSVLITRIYLNLTNIFSYLIILFTLQFVPIALHCQQVCVLVQRTFTLSIYTYIYSEMESIPVEGNVLTWLTLASLHICSSLLRSL